MAAKIHLGLSSRLFTQTLAICWEAGRIIPDYLNSLILLWALTDARQRCRDAYSQYVLNRPSSPLTWPSPPLVPFPALSSVVLETCGRAQLFIKTGSPMRELATIRRLFPIPSTGRQHEQFLNSQQTHWWETSGSLQCERFSQFTVYISFGVNSKIYLGSRVCQHIRLMLIRDHYPGFKLPFSQMYCLHDFFPIVWPFYTGMICSENTDWGTKEISFNS